MNPYKKYILLFVSIAAVLLLYNAIVWNFYTKGILTRDNGIIVGDLARTGYLPAYSHPRENVIDLPRQHVDIDDYEGSEIDLLTIGDSFSNGGAFGRNRYYQDYIASNQGIEVLNIRAPEEAANFIEAVALFANSGLLDKIKPKYVLIELAERSCSRLLQDIDFSKQISLERLKKNYVSREDGNLFRKEGALPTVDFFNTGNFKFGLYKIGYMLSDNAYVSMSYKVALDRPMFTGYGADTLLFINKDLKESKFYDENDALIINKKMNKLANILMNKNIKLYFMPAVNKYTLYYKYILDKKYPEGRFFELMESLPKDYVFVNTKKILADELEKGEKDIFFKDDTHWSWKASKAIFEKVIFE